MTSADSLQNQTSPHRQRSARTRASTNAKVRREARAAEAAAGAKLLTPYARLPVATCGAWAMRTLPLSRFRGVPRAGWPPKAWVYSSSMTVAKRNMLSFLRNLPKEANRHDKAKVWRTPAMAIDFVNRRLAVTREAGRKVYWAWAVAGLREESPTADLFGESLGFCALLLGKVDSVAWWAVRSDRLAAPLLHELTKPLKDQPLTNLSLSGQYLIPLPASGVARIGAVPDQAGDVLLQVKEDFKPGPLYPVNRTSHLWPNTMQGWAWDTLVLTDTRGQGLLAVFKRSAVHVSGFANP